jgi:phenylalanyl-tRNA synthetase beta chain
MRVPLGWLRDYVAWEGSAEELADLLSMSGTEVEAVLWAGAPARAENLALFRVGRVLHKERHPNADKLWLCRVAVAEGWEAVAATSDAAGETPDGAVRQIVCGADNFQEGDTVAVALSGSVLENGLKLRKANLRGVASDGMMLSEQELGFEAESPGIAILPADRPVGAPLNDYLPVSEAVLELEITPNRPDCLSVYGVAREVAAVTGLPLAPPPAEDFPTGGPPADEDVSVEVIDPDLCPRYGARVIRDVTWGESPIWMKARLVHAGMRPIANLVDVTNYAMHAVGEPLHAFDRDKIGGRRLIVRRAAPGERIVTLDDVGRELTPEMLVIADVTSPSAIAGVMGSEQSEVDPSTRHIVLEAATFSGPNIMRTSKALALRSEASNRFEKGLDQEYVPQGLALACRLYHELCGGTVAPGFIDVRSAVRRPPTIGYRPAKSNEVLGIAVPATEQADALRRLGCEVESADATPPADAVELAVTPPTWRADLEREVDLVEEVGRVHGLENVPETLPLRRDAVGGLTASQRQRRAAARALQSAGLDEVVTYTFQSEAALLALGLQDGDERLRAVRLANPMSAEQAIMRTTLLPRLLEAVRHNLAQQNYPVTVFEQGRVYLAPPTTPDETGAEAADRRLMDEDLIAATGGGGGGGEGDPGAVREGGPGAVRENVSPQSPRGRQPAVEREALAIALCGPLQPEHWLGESRPADFYLLKGLVERLLAELAVRDIRYERSSEPFLHPGKGADVLVCGRRAGYLGQLRPDVAAAFEIEGREVFVAELALDTLLWGAAETTTYEDLVAYPPATQDLAVVLPADVPAADVLALIRKAGGKLLRDASVFDVYEGDQVPSGKRSLAVRLIMRAPDRTLSEKDINGVRGKVIAALERELGATLR